MFAVVDYRMGNLKSVERGLRAVGADARITSDPAEIASADAVVLPGVGAFADAMASMDSLGETDAIRSAIADGKPFLGICLGQHLLFSDGVEGAPAGGTVKGLGILEGTVVRIPNRDADGKLYKIPHVGWNSIEKPQGLGVGEASTRSSARRESASGTFAKAGLYEHGGFPHPQAENVTEGTSAGGEEGGAPCTPRALCRSQRLLGRSHSPRLVERATGTFQSLRNSAWSPSLLAAGDVDLAGEALDGCGLFAGISEGEFFYFTHSYMAPDTPCTIASTVHSVRIPAAVAASDRVFGVQFHPEKSSDAGLKLLANFVRIANSVASRLA